VAFLLFYFILFYFVLFYFILLQIASGLSDAVVSLQVFTEMVRLTNENAVREHTDEDGDLFLWFKHQASQGIVGAQV